MNRNNYACTVRPGLEHSRVSDLGSVEKRRRRRERNSDLGIEAILRVQFGQGGADGDADGPLGAAEFDSGEQLIGFFRVASGGAEGGQQGRRSRVHVDDGLGFVHRQAAQLHELFGQHVGDGQRLPRTTSSSAIIHSNGRSTVPETMVATVTLSSRDRPSVSRTPRSSL